MQDLVILGKFKTVAVVTIMYIVQMKELFLVTVNHTKDSSIVIIVVTFNAGAQSFKERSIKGPSFKVLVNILVSIIEQTIKMIGSNLVTNIPTKVLTTHTTEIITYKGIVLVCKVNLVRPKAIGV